MPTAPEMSWYRLYLLTADNHIAAGQNFEAEGDQAAILCGRHVHDACADVFAGFEIWQEGRFVAWAAGSVPWPGETAAAVNGRLREAIVKTEEALRDSNTALAKSARLLARLDALGPVG